MAEKPVDETGYGPGTHAHDQGVDGARERARIMNELERQDRLDAAVTEAALREEFGEVDFYTGRQMLRAHAGSVDSARVRQIVAAARLPAGVNPANDPGVLKALATEILGPLPTRLEDATAEIEAMRKRMATPAWFADSKSQLRYRGILAKFPNIPPRQIGKRKG